MRWIRRSNTDSKSFCIRFPATVTTIPKGSGPPLGMSAMARPGTAVEHTGDLRAFLVGEPRNPRLDRPGGHRQRDLVQGPQRADERLDPVAQVVVHRGGLPAPEAAEGRASPPRT